MPWPTWEEKTVSRPRIKTSLSHLSSEHIRKKKKVTLDVCVAKDRVHWVREIQEADGSINGHQLDEVVFSGDLCLLKNKSFGSMET